MSIEFESPCVYCKDHYYAQCSCRANGLQERIDKLELAFRQFSTITVLLLERHDKELNASDLKDLRLLDQILQGASLG